MTIRHIIGGVILFLYPLVTFSQYLDEHLYSDDAYGIRHDRMLSAYEKLATNKGKFQGDDYPNFEPVGTLFVRGVESSATLISSTWIITAAHNLVIEGETLPDITEIEFVIGADFQDPIQRIGIKSIHLHPGWQANIITGPLDGIDIALIELDTSSVIEPALLYLEGEEPLQALVYSAGFGNYAPIANPHNWEIYSKRHAFENELDRKIKAIIPSENYPDRAQYSGGLLSLDFDAPNRGFNLLAEIPPYDPDYDIQFLGNGNSNAHPRHLEGTSIEGDSGGPLFIKMDNRWQVCGVASSGSSLDSGYGDIALYTWLHPHKAWIESVLYTKDEHISEDQ